MPVRLALVEDRPEVRQLLAERLGFFDDVELVFTASSAEVFFERLDVVGDLPEVVLMDIELPGMDGIAATARFKEEHPQLEVLMLTVFEDEERIFSAIKAGASGYLLKDASAGRIVGAVLEVARGGAPVSPLVAKKLLGYVRGDTDEENDLDITAREREVLDLIVEGLIEDAIADRLLISPHTVRGHIKNLYEKLQVHSRAEVVRAAYERRLIG
ncbi:MAG: response regulator transcription factor [Bacteroidetes bacterium]|nr:response regulator transcription factor [Bacteroidota bacterium]